MDKRYNPKEIENKTYAFWQNNDCFAVQPDKNKRPYTIMMPPPNVTGQLHMGHALDNTLQDVLIRAKRMQGYAALWLPGTDHAGIATQIKVEEELRNTEGISRHDLGREPFLERVWEWKHEYGGRIVEQLKRLGSSCDWSRLSFTMDENYAAAVREVFVNLYNEGLIYQGNRIINWCPQCTTALSDAEVEHSEHQGNFWHIRYPLADGTGEIIIATTRPETMLGDTAVAVNPDDKRYKHMIGKTLILPLIGREIPVIADEYVDAEFGTGAVKMTPAHDPNDFEVGLRHNLESVCVMTETGQINEHGKQYEGLDRYEARKKVVADLEKEGLLVKTQPHTHNVGECYRCSTIIEPMISKQWFVKMKPLAKEAIDVVNDGSIEFVPPRFAKTYLNWMENVHDWCISRQLWWGHRIPAFYCTQCEETAVTKQDIDKCPKCGGEVVQDEDVLDTWFSSALWPFATLGWPEKTEDLEFFYPTSVLVTGWDIIFFWVARMIFSGLHHMKEKPFDKVFIHGIVRDGEGRKMSKSLGNGIDPLEIIEEYGADALRAQLVSGNAPGNDMRFHTSRTEASRNFANKLWNSARFILMNKPESNLPAGAKAKTVIKHSVEDKWIISLCNQLAKEVNENIEKFELGMAFQKIYDFIWDEFCDWYIEMVKPRIQGDGGAAYSVLTQVLTKAIRLLHPFMPFITEEIHQQIRGEMQMKELYPESIMLTPFPQYDEKEHYPEEVEHIEALKEAIRAIRNVRAEMNVPPSKRVPIGIITEAPELFKHKFFAKLAYASEVTFLTEPPANAVCVTCKTAQMFMQQADLVDSDKERERLTKEKEALEKEVKIFSGKLSNSNFVDKAPASVVEEHKVKLANYQNMLEKVEKQLNDL